jgi:hypothetical protein
MPQIRAKTRDQEARLEKSEQSQRGQHQRYHRDAGAEEPR